MNFGKQLKEGLVTQNPVLVQLLGMCSTLAITTSISNGLGMGIAVTVVLICSNVVISLQKGGTFPKRHSHPLNSLLLFLSRLKKTGMK